MKLSAHFMIVSERPTGFSAEQTLFNRGFHELGRRTNATAWTVDGVDEVIRISEDSKGSQAFCDLARNLTGNPYMPVVFGSTELKSGDHVAHIEKLDNPARKDTYLRFRQIRDSLEAGAETSGADVAWYEETKKMAEMTYKISAFFMSPSSTLDIDSLPEPDSFRQAAIAVTELSLDMHRSNPMIYPPTPDMNRTNIMWRRLESGLQPILYDPVGLQRSLKTDELKHAVVLREKLGMPTDLRL